MLPKKNLSSNAMIAIVVACIAGLLLGAGLDQIFLRHVGHDQSWCVYAANLVLHGVTLDGSQLIESNPPFIIWFSCLPVLLGELLHIGILNGFRLFVDLTALASLCWTSYLIRRWMRPSTVAWWLFILAQIFATYWLIAEDSLGQREHLLVLMLLPYLVLAAARIRQQIVSTSHAILIGVIAGLAICLKPQHILAIIAVELLILFQRRTLSSLLQPAVLAFAVTLLAYLGSVYVFGRNYLANVVPELRLSYWAFDKPYPAVLRAVAGIIAGLALCWAMFFVLRKRLRFHEFAMVLGVAALGSLLAYVQQHKGWGYQRIPAGMFAVLFICTTLIGALDGWLDSEQPKHEASYRRPWVPVAALVAFGLISAGVDWRFGKRPGYSFPKKQDLARIYQSYPAGTSVSYLSTEPWEMPVIIEQGKILGQRFNHLWLLRAIILEQDPDSPLPHRYPAQVVSSLSNYQRVSIAQDFAHWRPAVVVVDECGPELCPSLQREHYGTVLRWFLQDPTFAEQWKQYAPAGKQGDLDIFHRLP